MLMEVKERICIKNFHVKSEDGRDVVLRKDEMYPVSANNVNKENDIVVITSTGWWIVSGSLFEEGK